MRKNSASCGVPDRGEPDSISEPVYYSIKTQQSERYPVQPLLVLILGGIVLFITLAVFLPYIQMLTSLSGP
jgi:type IV pilus assembly protein PilC